MKYGDLTYEEIRDRAHQDWLVIIPTGCTEQQGPHLPVDIDTWFVEQVCNAASAKADADFGVPSLVLPTIPFGPTPEHRNYGAGYIDIPVELHDSLVLSTLESLAGQGFHRIVVWRGCGGHDLRETVQSFNETFDGRSRAFLPGHPYHGRMVSHCRSIYTWRPRRQLHSPRSCTPSAPRSSAQGQDR